MEELQALADKLAAPPWIFTLALGLLLASRLPRRRRYRRMLAALSLLVPPALVALGMADERLRHRVLDPDRLPALVLLVGSGLILGLSRPPRADRRVAFSAGDAVAASLAVVSLALCALAARAPLAAMADPAARPDPAKAPWLFAGLQEVGFYFDPWVPGLALPVLLLGGLLALPWVETAAGRRDAVPLFLFGWVLLWLVPILVGTYLRGPLGHAFGPFEPLDASRPAMPAALTLSEVVWDRWLGTGMPGSRWLRESPGLLLTTAYFALLPAALARFEATRGAFRPYLEALGSWRYHAAMAWLLALLVVPLKMYGRWLFGIGTWIDLSELSFRL